jgi:hypothetical protein
MKMSAEKRRKILDKNVKEKGFLDTLRRVIAIAVELKNKHPGYAKKLRGDAQYLRKKYRPDLAKKRSIKKKVAKKSTRRSKSTRRRKSSKA